MYNILKEKKKEDIHFNSYYIKDSQLYHGLDDVKIKKKSILENIKDKLFWVRDMIINKIF